MNRLQTLRMIACMLLMGVVAIAAYLFYQHSLYFCLLFSLMIMASIIIYICQWQYKTTRMISRMIEGIRYADFSLSFSTQHKTRTEQRLAQEINNVVAEFRTRLSENEERYQYYETLLNTVYKPQNKMFHFCKTFCSKITLVNTIQNVILNPI